MMNFYPDNYYSGMQRFSGYGSDPWSRQQHLRRAQLQRQAAIEEERRQRALYERALREEHRRREEMHRREVLERKRREAEQRRRFLEREWQLQRQKEIELEKRLQLEQLEREKRERPIREKKNLRDYSQGEIVRGPDGCLYRMNLSDRDSGRQEGFPNGYPSSQSRDTRVRKLSDRRNDTSFRYPRSIYDEDNRISTFYESDMEMDESDNKENRDEIKSKVSDSAGTVKMSNVGVDSNKKEKKMKNKSKNSRRPPMKPSALIGGVEDASDDEQDDFTSVWRNRLPNEGEWMEPVKGYDVFW